MGYVTLSRLYAQPTRIQLHSVTDADTVW